MNNMTISPLQSVRMNTGKALKIILSKNAASSGKGLEKKPITGDGIHVACPNHLTLSDLPVAKSIGSVPAAARVKNIGSIGDRKPGSKVHFCTQCDHPIAIYGRLIPCEHAFCLDCARSNSKCTTCEEPITKIQSMKMGSGILICGIRSCHKSFLGQNELKRHIKECHGEADSTSVSADSEGELQ